MLKDLRYIDCHSHPHDEKYKREDVDVDKVLLDLKEDGGATIAIGTDFELSKQALELAKKHDNVWCTIGVHPADKGTLIPGGCNHAENFNERFDELYLQNKNKIVGVGECGLDYFYFKTTPDPSLAGGEEAHKQQIEEEKQRQKILFRQQIEFAIKHNLPLVLHGRPSKNSMDAYRDMLDILETSNQKLITSNQLRGHAHFFVGNLEIAKRFLDLGFLVSFDGPITFTKEYDEVIKFYPIEKIMIETDSPYAAPTPYRGQICYPTYVKEVAKKIAELKNLSVDEVLEITKNNTVSLFNLK